MLLGAQGEWTFFPSVALLEIFLLESSVKAVAVPLKIMGMELEWALFDPILVGQMGLGPRLPTWSGQGGPF